MSDSLEVETEEVSLTVRGEAEGRQAELLGKGSATPSAPRYFQPDGSPVFWVDAPGGRVRFEDHEGRGLGPEQPHLTAAIAYARRISWDPAHRCSCGLRVAGRTLLSHMKHGRAHSDGLPDVDAISFGFAGNVLIETERLPICEWPGGLSTVREHTVSWLRRDEWDVERLAEIETGWSPYFEETLYEFDLGAP
mgnify:FL=1